MRLQLEILGDHHRAGPYCSSRGLFSHVVTPDRPVELDRGVGGRQWTPFCRITRSSSTQTETARHATEIQSSSRPAAGQPLVRVEHEFLKATLRLGTAKPNKSPGASASLSSRIVAGRYAVDEVGLSTLRGRRGLLHRRSRLSGGGSANLRISGCAGTVVVVAAIIPASVTTETR